MPRLVGHYEIAIEFLLARNFGHYGAVCPGALNADIPGDDMSNPELEVRTFLSSIAATATADELLAATISMPSGSDNSSDGSDRPGGKSIKSSKTLKSIKSSSSGTTGGTPKSRKSVSWAPEASVVRYPVYTATGSELRSRHGKNRKKRVQIPAGGREKAGSRLVQVTLDTDGTTWGLFVAWAGCGSGSLVPWSAAMPQLSEEACNVLSRPDDEVRPMGANDERGSRSRSRSPSPVLEWLHAAFNIWRLQSQVAALNRRLVQVGRAMAQLRACLDEYSHAYDVAVVAVETGCRACRDEIERLGGRRANVGLALEATLDRLRGVSDHVLSLLLPEQARATLEAVTYALAHTVHMRPTERARHAEALLRVSWDTVYRISKDTEKLTVRIPEDHRMLEAMFAGVCDRPWTETAGLSRPTRRPAGEEEFYAGLRAVADVCAGFAPLKAQYDETVYATRVLNALRRRREVNPCWGGRPDDEAADPQMVWGVDGDDEILFCREREESCSNEERFHGGGAPLLQPAPGRPDRQTGTVDWLETEPWVEAAEWVDVVDRVLEEAVEAASSDKDLWLF